MGYEIKRVPLNFDAVLYEVWPGRLLEDAQGRWRPIEPPVGEGWQLWETVSEGAPVTPVFANRTALIEHLVSNDELGFDDANAQALVLAGSVVSGRLDVRTDGTHELRFSNQIPALTTFSEPPEAEDVRDWLWNHHVVPEILAIHYDGQGVPVHAIVNEGERPVYWFFRHSRRDARLYRTRRGSLPIVTPVIEWTPGQPTPENATFSPATLWENSDEAADGCYWNGYLNTWLPRGNDDMAKTIEALNDDWIARGSPNDD